MKTAIYYFSGTGNSLEVALSLAKGLDAEAIPIPSAIENPMGQYEKVGLVYPTYMYRPPYLVSDFIGKLKQPDYLFVVANCGGDPGDVLQRTKKLAAENSLRIDAGFHTYLPDNYTPFGGPPDDEKQMALFVELENKLNQMVAVVRGGGVYWEKKSSWFKTHIYPAVWYSIGYWAIPTYDKQFWLNDNCVGCGSCAKVCPVDNITMEEKKPHWNNHCQQCLACLQWCNKEAIELGKKTKGVPRYRNPHIKRRQIIDQKNFPETDQTK